MEKHFLKHNLVFYYIILLCTGALICTGCGFKEPIIEVLDGNYRFIQGDYTGATISYIQALEKETYTTWINYNLGNVYNALGETNAAIEELARATKAEYPEVLFRTHFNLGNIYYRLGNFEKAITHYKESLRAKPNEIDAKINLELAVEKMEKEKNITQHGSSTQKDREINNKINTEAQTLLEYIQQREVLIWRSLNQQTPVTGDTDDW